MLLHRIGSVTSSGLVFARRWGLVPVQLVVGGRPRGRIGGADTLPPASHNHTWARTRLSSVSLRLLAGPTWFPALTVRIVARLVPARPAAHRAAGHGQVPAARLSQSRFAVTRAPTHDHPPRSPRMPVMAGFRVLSPRRSLHVHRPIRTRVPDPSPRSRRAWPRRAAARGGRATASRRRHAAQRG